MRRISLIVLALVGLSACSVAAEPEISHATSSSHCQQISPLTGLCDETSNPYLIVKIDDAAGARPQYHLNEADLVIVEPVEAGMTRLFAVYQSKPVDLVGPIRSARITDVDLAPMFGKPGFAYSGAMTKLRPYLDAAMMQRVGAPQGETGYSRLTDRLAPHNYVADYQTLIDRIEQPALAVPKAGETWSFGENSTAAGIPIASAYVVWPDMEKKFVWNPVNKEFELFVWDYQLLSQLGASGNTENAVAKNILIMQTEFKESEFVDRGGNTTPYANTIGSGSGLALVNGKALAVSWSRASADSLPHWSLADGSELRLMPGNTWWLIVSNLADVSLKLVRK